MDLDFSQIYHFLFETIAGVGVLVAAGIVISIAVSAALELRTNKLFKQTKAKKGELSLFEESDEDYR